MHLVLTGATGNVGSALLRRLADTDTTVQGVTSRSPPPPATPPHRMGWTVCDLGAPQSVETLTTIMQEADAVVHLAWDIMGTGRREAQQRSNITGTNHVLTAISAAKVPQLVYLSSVAAYRPDHHKHHLISEDWPIGGIPGSAYSADKVAVEQLLNDAQTDYPKLQVARLRPPAVLQPAATGQLSRSLGRLAPLLRHRWLRPPMLPVPDLRIQVVHADDVADLIWRALQARADGAYHVAAEPVLGKPDIAAALDVRSAPVPSGLVRTAMQASAAVRLQPLDGSWWDLLTGVPLMSTGKALAQLGWQPAHAGVDTLAAVGKATLG